MYNSRTSCQALELAEVNGSIPKIAIRYRVEGIDLESSKRESISYPGALKLEAQQPTLESIGNFWQDETLTLVRSSFSS